MLVSPTNLLVALRTINNIWRYEYQNQHAQRIARQAGKIYDKLCGFVEDMDKLGRALSSADKCFTGAMGKLTSGRGNLIQQAHQIKQLGAETSKQLDSKLLDKALSSEAESEEKIEHLDAARKAVNES
jgi:DNA recombination protein RmuC